MAIGIKAKADKLAELQASLGKNDSAMAELIGCERQTYRNAKAGHNVSAGFVAKVTLAFNVPLDYYFRTTELENAVA